MRPIIASFVLVLAGCGSASQNRVTQTLGSDGWVCVADPVIACPGHECTGWDERWVAVCPDNGARFACRFAPTSDRRVICGRE